MRDGLAPTTDRSLLSVLHLEPVEDAGLGVAVLVALDDLDDLVARLGVEERRHAHVGHQVPADLAGVEPVTTPSWLSLRPAASPEIPLCAERQLAQASWASCLGKLP